MLSMNGFIVRVAAYVAAVLFMSGACGCANPDTANEGPLVHPSPAAAGSVTQPLAADQLTLREPATSPTLQGVILDHAHQPVSGAIVVVAHTLDATIFYGGGTLLNAIERRADEMPGVGMLPGNTIGKTTSDARGSFVFPSLASGHFSLVAIHPTRGCAVLADLDSAAGAATQVVLDPPTSVSARLVNLDVDPQWGYVNLETESPWANIQLALRMDRVGHSNEYTIGPIPDGCRWSIVAWSRNRSRAYDLPILSMPVSLSAGEKDSITIDATAGERIEGRILGPDDEPLADVGVIVKPRDPTLPTRGAFTGADGAYSIHGLTPGEYELSGVRHILRAEIGCGFGPVDVRGSRPLHIPVAAAEHTDLRVTSLVRTLDVGDEAPAFSGTAVDGQSVVLQDYRGRVVLIDFWATWCRVCLADMKHIANLHEELKENGNFAVISISLDEDPRAVERFLARQRLPWPQLVLGPADENPIARRYNVTSTPTTLLLDRHGRIAAKHIAGEDLKKEVQRILDSGE